MATTQPHLVALQPGQPSISPCRKDDTEFELSVEQFLIILSTIGDLILAQNPESRRQLCCMLYKAAGDLHAMTDDDCSFKHDRASRSERTNGHNTTQETTIETSKTAPYSSLQTAPHSSDASAQEGTAAKHAPQRHPVTQAASSTSPDVPSQVTTRQEASSQDRRSSPPHQMVPESRKSARLAAHGQPWQPPPSLAQGLGEYRLPRMDLSSQESVEEEMMATAYASGKRSHTPDATFVPEVEAASAGFAATKQPTTTSTRAVAKGEINKSAMMLHKDPVDRDALNKHLVSLKLNPTKAASITNLFVVTLLGRLAVARLSNAITRHVERPRRVPREKYEVRDKHGELKETPFHLLALNGYTYLTRQVDGHALGLDNLKDFRNLVEIAELYEDVMHLVKNDDKRLEECVNYIYKHHPHLQPTPKPKSDPAKAKRSDEHYKTRVERVIWWSMGVSETQWKSLVHCFQVAWELHKHYGDGIAILLVNHKVKLKLLPSPKNDLSQVLEAIDTYIPKLQPFCREINELVVRPIIATEPIAEHVIEAAKKAKYLMDFVQSKTSATSPLPDKGSELQVLRDEEARENAPTKRVLWERAEDDHGLFEDTPSEPPKRPIPKSLRPDASSRSQRLMESSTQTPKSSNRSDSSSGDSQTHPGQEYAGDQTSHHHGGSGAESSQTRRKDHMSSSNGVTSSQQKTTSKTHQSSPPKKKSTSGTTRKSGKSYRPGASIQPDDSASTRKVEPPRARRKEATTRMRHSPNKELGDGRIATKNRDPPPIISENSRRGRPSSQSAAKPGLSSSQQEHLTATKPTLGAEGTDEDIVISDQQRERGSPSTFGTPGKPAPSSAVDIQSSSPPASSHPRPETPKHTLVSISPGSPSLDMISPLPSASPAPSASKLPLLSTSQAIDPKKVPRKLSPSPTKRPRQLFESSSIPELQPPRSGKRARRFGKLHPSTEPSSSSPLAPTSAQPRSPSPSISTQSYHASAPFSSPNRSGRPSTPSPAIYAADPASSSLSQLPRPQLTAPETEPTAPSQDTVAEAQEEDFESLRQGHRNAPGSSAPPSAQPRTWSQKSEGERAMQLSFRTPEKKHSSRLSPPGWREPEAAGCLPKSSGEGSDEQSKTSLGSETRPGPDPSAPTSAQPQSPVPKVSTPRLFQALDTRHASSSPAVPSRKAATASEQGESASAPPSKANSRPPSDISSADSKRTIMWSPGSGQTQSPTESTPNSATSDGEPLSVSPEGKVQRAKINWGGE